MTNVRTIETENFKILSSYYSTQLDSNAPTPSILVAAPRDIATRPNPLAQEIDLRTSSLSFGSMQASGLHCNFGKGLGDLGGNLGGNLGIGAVLAGVPVATMPLARAPPLCEGSPLKPPS